MTQKDASTPQMRDTKVQRQFTHWHPIINVLWLDSIRWVSGALHIRLLALSIQTTLLHLHNFCHKSIQKQRPSCLCNNLPERLRFLTAAAAAASLQNKANPSSSTQQGGKNGNWTQFFLTLQRQTQRERDFCRSAITSHSLTSSQLSYTVTSLHNGSDAAALHKKNNNKLTIVSSRLFFCSFIMCRLTHVQRSSNTHTYIMQKRLCFMYVTLTSKTIVCVCWQYSLSVSDFTSLLCCVFTGFTHLHGPAAGRI